MWRGEKADFPYNGFLLENEDTGVRVSIVWFTHKIRCMILDGSRRSTSIPLTTIERALVFEKAAEWADTLEM